MAKNSKSTNTTTNTMHPMYDTSAKKMIFILGMGLLISMILMKLIEVYYQSMPLMDKLKAVMFDGMIAPLIVGLWMFFQLYKVTCLRDGGCQLLASLNTQMVLAELIVGIILFVDLKM